MTQRMPGPRLSTIDVKPRSQCPRAVRRSSSPLGGRCARSGNLGRPTGTTRQSSERPPPSARTSLPSGATEKSFPPPSS
ncbi:MAG: hypothetical protein ACRDL2_17315 [Gaiellaceae bacterium]